MAVSDAFIGIQNKLKVVAALAQMPESESEFMKALSSVRLSDFKNFTALPCTKKALFSGVAVALPVGFIRYFISRKWRSAGNWGVLTWAFIGSISYQYCIYQRRIVLQEFEKMGQIK